jgi:DNA polymerase sigma
MVSRINTFVKAMIPSAKIFIYASTGQKTLSPQQITP